MCYIEGPIKAGFDYIHVSLFSKAIYIDMEK